MASGAGSDVRRWLGPTLALVIAVTAARILVLSWDHKQLFVDEAQYWLWSQDLRFGYWSKPPLIAWLIRAVTELAGSDAPFWIRLPAPILHGATALTLAAIAARLGGAAAAVWTAAAYLSLPIVALGSLLMTTDTLLFPFLAAAYLVWTIAVAERRTAWAAAAGALIGLGFLAKYAAIYFVGAACLAAAFVPAMRPRWAEVLAALAGFLLASAPNVLWNLANGLATIQHTVDNVDWARAPSERAGLEWEELGEFVAAQFVAFGPVLLVGLGWATFRWRRLPAQMRSLVLFSVPIILLMCVQALLSRAYANWAATAYLTATVVVVLWLQPRRAAWLWGGVGLNAAICCLVAVVVVAPGWLPARVSETALSRYLGRVEMTEAIIAVADDEGVATVVSDNRDILADLFYTGRNRSIAYRAMPSGGAAQSHYHLYWAFEGSPSPVLFVGTAAPDCVPGRPPVAEFAPSSGYYAPRPQRGWIVPGDCWQR